jgi:hypothetical protein
MSDPGARQSQADIDALLRQQDDEELIEIDENGNIHRRGELSLGKSEKKPTVLRDPHGEYGTWVRYPSPDQ